MAKQSPVKRANLFDRHSPLKWRLLRRQKRAARNDMETGLAKTMSESLPDGWTETTIGAVTARVEQRIPLPKDEFFYIDISSVDRNTKRIANPQKITGEKAPSRARQVIKHGDVLVSMTRPNLNAVAIVPSELDGQIASTGFDVLRSQNLDSRWLYYLVRTDEFVSTMTDLVQGALYPAVRPRDIRNFEIPLAPLDEQKRITDKLDTLLARVGQCQTHLDRLPHLLKAFRQSVLAAATSGQLTEEWRKANVQDNEFQEIQLRDCFDIFSGYAFKKKEYSSGGSRLLQIANVGYGITLWEDQNFIDLDVVKSTYANFQLQVGDIVMALNRPITNDTLKVARVKDEDLPATLYQRVACLRLKIPANPNFAFLYLQTDNFMNQVKQNLKGSDQPYINTSSLDYLTINLPPLAEQHEIVRRVECLFAFAERLETRWRAAQGQLSALTPSLLAKAFRGELV